MDEPIIRHAIDGYLNAAIPPRPSYVAALEDEAARSGFPIVGPQVGRLLTMLAGVAGARRAIELGSGFGYSAWWLAQGLGAGGTVIATDRSPEDAERARQLFMRAGLADRLDFRVGDALPIIESEKGPFDLIFIDIDKKQYPRALELAVPRLRPGGFLVADNLLRDGSVLDREPDESTRAILEYTRRAVEHPDLWTLVLPIRDGVGVSWRKP